MPLHLLMPLTSTSPCLTKRRVLSLSLVCFSLNSATNRELPCLILKSATGIFFQESFALLLKQRLLIPVSAADKFIAVIVKEYFILLPGRDSKSSICSRAIFRTVMVSS